MRQTQDQYYFNLLEKGLNQQLAATIEWLSSKEAQRFFNERTRKIQSFWKTSQMREQWDEITQANVKDSQEYIEHIYETGARLGYSELGRIVGVTQADRDTLFYLKEYNYDLIKRMNDDMIQNIRSILTGAEAEGLHPFETAGRLADAGLEPIRGLSPLQRARTIARTESRRARTVGTAQAYVNYGVEKAEIITYSGADATVEDMEADGVCEDCIDLYENNPYPVMEIASLVPVHPNCYHPKTQLYTQKDGWKPIKDITTDDKVLTINPETKEPVFQHPIATIEKKAKKLVRIYNKWFETVVTQDHDCLVYQRQGKDRGIVPNFRKPNELNSESRFLRTCRNSNVSPDAVVMNGLKVDIEDFIFLTAWFLSEGSVLHDLDQAEKRGYPVKISQQTHHRFLENKLKAFANKYYIKLAAGKEYFELYNERLYNYFKRFGYSHEKYIPSVLFECSQEDIKRFLDFYVMGDGHETKPNHLNSIGKTIYTSSTRMRDDLSYLILLAGYYPSIRLHSSAGTVVKHRNGEYIQNHDVYCLRLNKTEYTHYKSCNTDTIDYDGFVYCVEVPEYHTLWTLCDGRTSWNGNCRCVIASVNPDADAIMNADAKPVIDESIKDTLKDKQEEKDAES